MRPKTAKEKEFNSTAATYKIKAFTACDFDNDEALKKAFDSFTECMDAIELKDPSLEGESLDIYYIDFLETYNQSEEEINEYLINNHDIENVILCTKNLFELHTSIEEISCLEYFDAYTLKSMSLRPSKIQNKIVIIQEKIQSWHQIRREIHKIKPFIEAKFPRWAKASAIEKKAYRKEIEKLIDDLKILKMDTSKLEKVHHFMTNYTGLNQLSKYKADTLLDLKLPLINSRVIANKILKNSIL